MFCRFVLVLNYTVKLSESTPSTVCSLWLCDVQWRGCTRRDGCWKSPIINAHCVLPFRGITAHNGQLPVVIRHSIQLWHADMTLKRKPTGSALKLISSDYILGFSKDVLILPDYCLLGLTGRNDTPRIWIHLIYHAGFRNYQVYVVSKGAIERNLNGDVV